MKFTALLGVALVAAVHLGEANVLDRKQHYISQPYERRLQSDEVVPSALDRKQQYISQPYERRLQADGVVSLTVLDGDRGVESNDDSWDFMELVDGAVIDLDNLGDLTEEDARGVHWGTARINIRATTQGDVGSVVFDYDDGEFVSIVQVGANPYETLMWERDFVFTNGYHTLKVTGYGGNNGNGMELAHVEVGFTIISAVTEGAQNVPEFTSDWISLEDMPIRLSETPSALVDGNLVVFNGFLSLEAASNKVFAFDLTDPSASWRSMPDYPLPQGATHIPIATHGTKAYLIGGYLGREERPPPDMVECFEFDIAGNGGAGSWRALPSLPLGRGAGGAFYLEGMHTIAYSLGATRNRDDGTIDRLTTWWLDLNNEAAGWVQKNDGPYFGNHIKEAVAKDCDGNEHYFMFGGQFSEAERDHNLDDVWEYFPATDHWEQRASMIMPRGHLASGEYSCGFLIVAGAIDYYSYDGMKTYDISYYDIPTDTWTRVGDAPDDRNTYACAVLEDDFYCTAGFSPAFKKRSLAVPAAAPGPTASPTPSPPAAEPLYKLNCGGPGRVADGWESDDPYVLFGRAVDRTNFLLDRFDPDGPDFIYMTERHDTARDIEYSFPDVPDGDYEVEFMFAEIQGAIKSGDRIFSFSAEGQPIPEITNLDIYAQVGFAVPITFVVDVTVSDGNGLQISSSAIADDAKIQGLIITPKTGGSTPTPTTPAPSATASDSPSELPTIVSNDPTVVYQINCGGDPEFPGWEADDAYVSDGWAYRRNRIGANHPNYSELFMYNTERHDMATNPIEYEFAVDNGTYDIDIYWIEAQVDGVGLRTMDVSVEGSLVLDDFDIYDYAAGVLGDGVGARNEPFIYTVSDVVVTDGSLSLSFAPVLDDAKVNGLVITQK